MNNEFLKLNRFEMFFYSINSKPTNDRRPFPKLESPIKISSDMHNYRYNCHDLRVNGFGPLYSIAILLSFIGLFYALYRKYPINKYIIISLMYIFMSFSIPTTWWARLVPMMWVVPIFFSIYFYVQTDKFLKLFSFTIILLLLVNVSLVDFHRLHHDYIRTLKEKQTLSKMLVQKNYIAFPEKGIGRSGYRTILHKLNMNMIDFEVIKHGDCKKIDVFYDAMICTKIK